MTLVVAVFLTSQFLAGVLTTEFSVSNNPESQRGDQLLEDRITGPRPLNEVVIVRSSTLTVDSPAFRSKVEAVNAVAFASVNEDGDKVVASGITYYGVKDESLVSKNRRATILPYVLTGDLDVANENVVFMHDAARGFLPKGKLMHGAVFSLFLLFTFGSPVIDPNNDDFVQFRHAGVSVVLFGLLFLLFGLLMGFTAPLFNHLVPRIQQEDRRRWLLLVLPSSLLSLVLLAVAIGFGGPLGLLILGLVLLLAFALILFGAARIRPLVIRIAGIVRMPAIPAKRKTAALLIALVIPPIAGGALLLSRVIEILYP
ncbi:MAG: hypothetical protein EXR49_05810 [Dehalococcoidia bacterium]|nr:hypothetical protein [Dehalococcoidia bacterium]